MLGDLLLLVDSAGCGGRTTIGHLVLDCTVGSAAGGQLAGSYMFTHAAVEIVRLTDIDDCSFAVADPILAGTCRRPGACTRGGVILRRTAGFIDRHKYSSLSMGWMPPRDQSIM